VQTNDRITVTRSGGTETGQSGLFDVTTTNVDHFAISNITTQTAGFAFSVTLTAEDANNNTVTDFNGTVSLSDLTGTISPTTSGSFSSGAWTGNVTITESRTSNRRTC
jgi:ABC-type molybdate transport system substrate-binding protein